MAYVSVTAIEPSQAIPSFMDLDGSKTAYSILTERIKKKILMG
jgi:hypothetical protein